MLPLTQRPSALFFSFLLFLNVIFDFAVALPEDKTLPFELTSDSAQFDQAKGLGVYKGNVLLKQGTMEIRSTESRVYMVNQELEHIEGDGPIKMKYLPEITKPWINGQGEKLHYDAKTGIVTLTGNAKIIQGEDEISGDVMTYDVNKDIVRAVGDGKKQVRIEIKPNSALKDKK